MGEARRHGSRWGQTVAGIGVVAALMLGTLGCAQDSPRGDGPKPTRSATPSTAPSSPQGPTTLTVSLWGRPAELPAYRAAVDAFNLDQSDTRVQLQTSEDSSQAVAAAAGPTPPDVFLISRRDLLPLIESKQVLPVDNLLEERGVDFGDDFNRDAVASFGSGGRLQCMPYGISPMVIYYNTDLVNVARMQSRGLDVPLDPTTWTMAQFEAAAKFATRPAKGIRGFSVEPSLRALAPFVYSAGGEIFNDRHDPTSLDFSSDDTRSALETVLPVLRNAPTTLSDQQLQEADALTWFKRGKLAMIAGYRDLTPELRGVRGLQFDVRPMPTIDSFATVGDITGLCISAQTADPQAAADLITWLVGADSLSKVAQAGYLVPANNAVASSEAFMQPDQQPANAAIFVSSIRGMVIAPMLRNAAELTEIERPLLQELLMAPGEIDLDEITQRIDDASKPLLDPDYEPSASASAGASASG